MLFNLVVLKRITKLRYRSMHQKKIVILVHTYSLVIQLQYVIQNRTISPILFTN